MHQENLVGIDVSAATLDAVRRDRRGQLLNAAFSNDTSGHKKLISWATRRGSTARICIEATGVYSFQLAMALHQHPKTEVMVVNPRAIKSFGQALMQRAKIDLVDAEVILAFVERMAFASWHPPPEEVLQLQSLSRRIEQVKVMLNQELNRRHAYQFRAAVAKWVLQDIEVNIRHLRRRIARLETHGLELIAAKPELQGAFQRLVSIKGVAAISAMRILAELLTLPPDLKPSQWVAQAGLDPRARESGASVHGRRFISRTGNKHLRHALYMPALVALRHEPHVKAFYEKLLAAGKRPMQAVVAVMRKLLRSIWGMLNYNQDFEDERFYEIHKKAA